jgi:hypothetical protein
MLLLDLTDDRTRRAVSLVSSSRVARISESVFVLPYDFGALSGNEDYGASGEAGAFQPVKDRRG